MSGSSSSPSAAPLRTDGVTDELCKFIVDARYEQLDDKLVDKLKDLVTDCIGISAGAAAVCESTESFLKAVTALGKARPSPVATAGINSQNCRWRGGELNRFHEGQSLFTAICWFLERCVGAFFRL